MTDTVTVAVISAAGSLAVAITALLLNNRLFGSIERNIELIHADLRQFFHELGEHDKRITRLENGRPPNPGGRPPERGD